MKHGLEELEAGSGGGGVFGTPTPWWCYVVVGGVGGLVCWFGYYVSGRTPPSHAIPAGCQVKEKISL